ncbi:MAG: beta-ketoacyl-ACP synthase II [Holophagaceae bacterium]
MSSHSKRRVVITGMGTINPCGNNVNDTWDSLVNAQSGISLIDRFDTSEYSCKIAGQVKGFNPDNFIDRKDQKKMDIFIQYAMAASSEAWDRAGLNQYELTPSAKERFGVYIGSGIGGLDTIWHEASQFRGPRRISPFFIPSLIVNMASGSVGIRYGLKGPNSSVATACATGNHAIGDAFRLIAHDYADLMIAGGSDSVINPLGVGGFSAMRALSTRNDNPMAASRPFDKDRDGFVMAEGAGILILEERDHALARGAKIHAEILGYGMSGDAYHITSPSPDGDGGSRVMKLAMMDANITPDQVGYINMHGTSTPVGDQIECKAIRNIFGSHAESLNVSSTKSMHGHLLGAAGGLETIVTIMALEHQLIPPTINVDNQDPNCNLNVTPNKSCSKQFTIALNNGFGFGGTNACLVLGKN